MGHVAQDLVRVLVLEPGPPAVPCISGLLPAGELLLTVSTTSHRDEAFAGLEREDFDCAVLDCSGPVADPRDLMDEYHRRRLGTPVIIVTDPRHSDAAAELRRAGAIDCIMRPDISRDRLSMSLMNALRLRYAGQRVAEAERRISFSARHDPLTKLGNRALFFERLEHAISVATREGKQLALLLMDLNRFREVNESLGHRVGDMLLEEVAGRMRTTLRASDLVTRFGDDEFAVLLQTGAALTGAVTAAGKLLGAMKEPFIVDEHRFLIGCSIGIALFPSHGRNADTLLRHAETAMREAKRDANGFVIYSGEEDSESAYQLSLAHDLRHAIANNELDLYYQPMVSMKTERICGVEALLRWKHPTHGMVAPDVFIPLAEQTGTIDRLTTSVLDTALEQWQQWRQSDIDLVVSVNLSPLTLHRPDFPGAVQAMMTKWAVPPKYLVLEITESAIVSDAVRAAETVNRLHALGVRISIDDFGTGYSSLAYLRRLPVSELKVDKSYVMNMTGTNDDLVIVRTLIELGHNLDLQVVAEGVEDAETWNVLADLGCDICQGFYMGRPVDSESLTAWLEDSPWGIRAERANEPCRLVR